MHRLNSTGPNRSYECTLSAKFSKDQEALGPPDDNTATSPAQWVVKVPQWSGDAQLPSARGWLSNVSLRTLPGPVPQQASPKTRAQGSRRAAAAETHPAARCSPPLALASHTVFAQGPRACEGPASRNPDVALVAHRNCVIQRRKWRAVAPAAT